MTDHVHVYTSGYCWRCLNDMAGVKSEIIPVLLNEANQISTSPNDKVHPGYLRMVKGKTD